WLDQLGARKPIVKEETTITIFKRHKNYRRIDFKITLLAQEPQVSIGGSEDEKGYGGFSPRIKLQPEMLFRGPNGLVQPTNLPVAAQEWIDISGPIGLDGRMAGCTIIAHPSNPDYPNPWILRTKGSMQNAVFPFPGRVPIPLSQDKALTLKYSLLVHNGMPSISKLSKIAKRIK
ncbi:MAG: DUF6807 family protein, partial [Bacteroidota bacterium]